MGVAVNARASDSYAEYAQRQSDPQLPVVGKVPKLRYNLEPVPFRATAQPQRPSRPPAVATTDWPDSSMQRVLVSGRLVAHPARYRHAIAWCDLNMLFYRVLNISAIQ